MSPGISSSELFYFQGCALLSSLIAFAHVSPFFTWWVITVLHISDVSFPRKPSLSLSDWVRTLTAPWAPLSQALPTLGWHCPSVSSTGLGAPGEQNRDCLGHQHCVCPQHCPAEDRAQSRCSVFVERMDLEAEAGLRWNSQDGSSLSVTTCWKACLHTLSAGPASWSQLLPGRLSGYSWGFCVRLGMQVQEQCVLVIVASTAITTLPWPVGSRQTSAVSCSSRPAPPSPGGSDTGPTALSLIPSANVY